MFHSILVSPERRSCWSHHTCKMTCAIEWRMCVVLMHLPFKRSRLRDERRSNNKTCGTERTWHFCNISLTISCLDMKRHPALRHLTCTMRLRPLEWKNGSPQEPLFTGMLTTGLGIRPVSFSNRPPLSPLLSTFHISLSR